MGGRGTRAWASVALAIVVGVLMVYSGFATQSFLMTALNYAQEELSNFVGGIAGLTLGLVIYAILLLIGLGGITVILGGLALWQNHVSIGRFLIMLGGGAGFLGLLVSFSLTAYKAGLYTALGYAPHWIGLVFAVVARRLAKGTDKGRIASG